ncbi:hypothetical protein CDD80_1822 [Ophiocordyceps camponoti-rufipedis]|uniref:Uncharacterized protein n=1 Tax=Ophiocordyceps camponoti-rufipedis TaxID=2004952 RepID=A0A2C5ZH77_9HYPO|nr:hypothetical protein CDD80_1822 [Ophiocordyceps camponoti-rufipedis]
MAPPTATPEKSSLRLTRMRARLAETSSIMGGLDARNQSTEPARRIRVIIHTPQSRHRARMAALEARLDALRREMDLIVTIERARVAIEHAEEISSVNDDQEKHQHHHNSANNKTIQSPLPPAPAHQPPPPPPPPPPAPVSLPPQTQLPGAQPWNFPDWDGESSMLPTPPVSPRSTP